MNFLTLVKKRKSIRKYSSRPVPREMIDSCLEAARLAPSACNSQPWSFIVVDDEKIRNEIVKKALSGIYKMNAFVREAPTLIVVLTEHSTYIARMGGQLRHVKYSLIDIGIACEHLILRAVELGLGTCWLGWFNEKAVKKVLGLPKSKRIDVMISLGYPEVVEGKDKKRKSLKKIRRYFSD
ncbi:MAG: nitroreductase family protein [Candidatus Aminicenantes bacterium]|nr:nitroreductase family protein [Candidatus Aminicenantes bacterium]